MVACLVLYRAFVLCRLDHQPPVRVIKFLPKVHPYCRKVCCELAGNAGFCLVNIADMLRSPFSKTLRSHLIPMQSAFNRYVPLWRCPLTSWNRCHVMNSIVTCSCTSHYRQVAKMRMFIVSDKSVSKSLPPFRVLLSP